MLVVDASVLQVDGWCWGENSCGNFWKHRQSILNLFNYTLTKNRRLKIESLTKMDDCFTMCQYKTEQPINIGISAPVSLGFVLVWNKHVFPRSKMTVFQTYNKKYGIKNVDKWVEAWNKMLCMISYMLRCTHLHSRYEKSDFFSSDFISLLSYFRGI